MNFWGIVGRTFGEHLCRADCFPARGREQLRRAVPLVIEAPVEVGHPQPRPAAAAGAAPRRRGGQGQGLPGEGAGPGGAGDLLALP